MAIESRNPATGELIEAFESLSADELEQRLTRGWRAFMEHRRVDRATHAACLRRAARILEAERERFGRLMTEEMGKPLAAAVAEAEKCAWVCRFYADHAAAFLADQVVATDATRSWVRYDPIGPVLAVMPWNFPFWQVFRFAAPALMAGNVGLLKHASNVPRCALAIEEIFTRAGFGDGAFQALLIEVSDVERLLDDPRVRAATLTGSTRAGSAVAERAGRRIKKTVLELGGSDPFIVMPSADLDRAVQTAVTARTINSGQSCIAAKRFIVHDAVYDRFAEAFVERLSRLSVGDPMDEETVIGPLATSAIVEEVDGQVQRSIEAGARLLTGGKRIPGPGNYYQPTALDRLPEGSAARVEEVFGPVASLFRVSGLEEAIRIANETSFGLGSSVWTHSDEERNRFIEELDTGQVFVNAMVASDPRLPFGGVKESGYGRELGVWGIREFVNAKTVWVGGRSAASTE